MEFQPICMYIPIFHSSTIKLYPRTNETRADSSILSKSIAFSFLVKISTIYKYPDVVIGCSHLSSIVCLFSLTFIGPIMLYTIHYFSLFNARKQQQKYCTNLTWTCIWCFFSTERFNSIQFDQCRNGNQCRQVTKIMPLLLNGVITTAKQLMKYLIAVSLSYRYINSNIRKKVITLQSN